MLLLLTGVLNTADICCSVVGFALHAALVLLLTPAFALCCDSALPECGVEKIHVCLLLLAPTATAFVVCALGISDMGVDLLQCAAG